MTLQIIFKLKQENLYFKNVLNKYKFCLFIEKQKKMVIILHCILREKVSRRPSVWHTCPTMNLLVETSTTHRPITTPPLPGTSRLRKCSAIDNKYEVSGFLNSDSPSISVPCVTIAHISRFTTYKKPKHGIHNLINCFNFISYCNCSN